MDIKHLIHVVALADKRNFARAAEQVNLSQPALSRSIQAIEAELGLQLFDRGGSEVAPTRAGDFLLERARRIVFESRCLKQDMEHYRDAKVGDTCFGIGPIQQIDFLPPLLKEIRWRYPNVKMRIMSGCWKSQLKLLRDETTEFFLGNTDELNGDDSLTVLPVYQEPGGFCVRRGHPLLSRGSVTVADVWKFGVASLTIPLPIRESVATRLGWPIDQPLPLVIECDDLQSLKQVTDQTDTVLAIPVSAVAREIAAGMLVHLKVEDPPCVTTGYGIVMLRGRTPSPMAAKILGFIQAIAEGRNTAPMLAVAGRPLGPA